MNICKVAIACLISGVLLSSTAFGAKAKLPAGQLFGPTGIIGDLSKNSIKVNGAQPGSPADGKVKKGDEIIGLSGQKFKDVKMDMAKAIDVAETEAAGGKMTLMLKGNKTVDITLPVLGSYSATAPLNCAKSDKIITMTADALLKDPKGIDTRLKISLLGLMATGEKKYIDAAGKAIQAGEWTRPDDGKIEQLLAGEIDMSYVTWPWGYYLTTLGEYYLLTGDKSVLPGMKTYAVALAKGQDAGGMYGHRLISAKRNGRLPGYAQMNQPSITCFMGMIMAAKCGITDPALTAAIQKTYTYIDSHVGKGGFPYGVHGANSGTFNNNGTSGSAAVCMLLMGKPEATKYFSQITAPTYDGLEKGHASTFFNPIWTSLGANLSGPEVYQQFFPKTLWYHNLKRHWDGNWANFGKEGRHAGIALLAYSAPRRKLLITGRNADKSIWAKGQDATAVMTTTKIDYKSMSDEDLMDMAMNHFLPQVRRRASAAFGERREKLTPTWIKFLKEGDPKQKMLAIGQYGWWHPIEVRLPQMELIGAVLRDESQPVDVRAAAAGSLAYMGEPAQKFYPDIVKLLAMDKENDPLELIDGGIGKSLNVLCNTPFTSGLVPDKTAHYKAALKLIRNKRQNARAEGAKMVSDMPLEDFYIVAKDLIHLIENKDPTYHSYHNPGGSIGSAIGVLANLNIREGIGYALGIREIPSGKGSFKLRATMDSLAKYGANAKPILEEMKKDEAWKGVPGNRKLARNWNNMVKAIEEDKDPKQLITLEEAIKAGKK